MSQRNYDISTGVLREGNTMHVQHSQDVDPTLKSIQQIKDKGDVGKDMKHVARIPQMLFMQWAYEDCGDKMAYLEGRHNKDPELALKLAARLNSNEFKAFRIWEGNVSTSDFVKEGNKFNKE